VWKGWKNPSKYQSFCSKFGHAVAPDGTSERCSFGSLAPLENPTKSMQSNYGINEGHIIHRSMITAVQGHM